MKHSMRSAVIACALAQFARGLTAGEPTRLTHDGRQKYTPVFCNDGEHLVFVDLETPSLLRLKRLRIADGQIEALHPDVTTSEFEPAWARSANVYAYAHTRGTLSVSVIIRGENGRQAEVLPGGGFDGLRSPAVSSEGTRVLFAHSERGRQQIFSVSPEGKDERPLTDSAGNNNWPDFSPDGRQIVFASSRTGNYEICVMQADGSNVRQLTDSPLQDIRPRFSPDGQRIAFTSHRDGNAELYVINADGSDEKRVTVHDERDDYPAWHPNGKQLIAVCEREGEFDLYLIDVP